jgi:hypothetical protein
MRHSATAARRKYGQNAPRPEPSDPPVRGQVSKDMRRNIELKARCPNLAAARAAALRVGATPVGVLEQLDTYFRVPHGRLKLARRPAVPPS